MRARLELHNNSRIDVTFQSPASSRGLWMRRLIPVAGLLVIAALSGCMSRAKARELARQAYLAGQRDAIAQAHQQQQSIPGAITFIGPVDLPVIPFEPGMTLARAIVVASCNSPYDPARITIRRNTEEIHVDPERLLEGRDVPLQPGDIVQFTVPPGNVAPGL